MAPDTKKGTQLITRGGWPSVALKARSISLEVCPFCHTSRFIFENRMPYSIFNHAVSCSFFPMCLSLLGKRTKHIPSSARFPFRTNQKIVSTKWKPYPMRARGERSISKPPAAAAPIPAPSSQEAPDAPDADASRGCLWEARDEERGARSEGSQ